MSLTAYKLDGDAGVVIVESVSGIPLPLSIYTFAEVDEAEDFISWLAHMSTPFRRNESRDEWDRAVREWSLHWELCPHCEKSWISPRDETTWEYRFPGAPTEAAKERVCPECSEGEAHE